MQIDALIFDWVGVLLRVRTGAARCERSIRVDEYISRQWRKETTEAGLVAYVGIDPTDFEQTMATYISETFEAYEPLWMQLPALKRRYRLAVINNGPALTLPFFEDHFGFRPHGIFVNSEQEQAWKPNPAIFRATLTRLGVAPEHALYMDDAEWTAEIEKITGIRSLRWVNHQEGFASLQRLLDATVEQFIGGDPQNPDNISSRTS